MKAFESLTDNFGNNNDAVGLREGCHLLINTSYLIINTADSLCQLLGYGPQELLQKDFFNALGLSKSDQIMIRERASGPSLKGEFGSFWITKKDKSIEFYSLHFVIKLGAETINIRFEKASSEKRQSYLLNRVVDFYYNFYEHSLSGLLTFTFPFSLITHTNQRSNEILNLKGAKDAVLSDYFFDYNDWNRFVRNLYETYRVDNEQVRFRSGGSFIWVMLSIKYYPEEGICEAVIQDITEFKKQFIELKEVKAELNEFIYRTSHDLRSPISSILGLINLMRIEKYHNQDDYLDKIEERARHLDLLLRDILYISFNRNSQLQYDFINFEAEVESIINDYKIFHPFTNIEVSVNCSFVSVSDKNRIRIALLNLIGNAFKFQKPHQIDGRIVIDVRNTKDSITIKVADNGIGIEVEHQSRIFDIFYRATSQGKGSGLGLYIVKNIVEHLNGQIFVESTRDFGSSFTIIVPNKVPQL